MVKKLLKTLIGFLLVLGAWNEVSAQKINEVKLNTPRETVKTHIEFLQHGNYHPFKAAKVIPVKDSVLAKELAVKLKQILDAKGLYVEYSNIPDRPDYKDTNRNKKEYILFNTYPRIYLSKKGDKWFYSRETAEAIPEIYNQVFPFGADKLVNLIPKSAQKEFLGLALWKYLGLAIIFLLSYLFYRIGIWIFNKIVHSGLRKVVGDRDADRYERSISRFLSLILVLALINLFLPILQLPVNFSHYFFLALRIFIPLLMTLILYRVMDLLGVYMMRAAENTETTFDDQFVPLVRKTLKGIVILVGFLFILQNLNFNITGILAGLSIGGLAFALAAQETIKNLFGSLMIFVDRPFQVGDYVRLENDIAGIIEDVGFRSTKVRTFEQSLVSVPNGKLANMNIDNMQMRLQRQFYTHITITYDTPPALVETFRDGIKRLIEEHPNTDKSSYYVNLNALDAYSLNIIIWCYFETEEWEAELKYREELLLSIMKLAEEIGVRFAFPTSIVHVEDFPGQLAKTPLHKEGEGDMQKKLEAFFEKRKQNGD